MEKEKVGKKIIELSLVNPEAAEQLRKQVEPELKRISAELGIELERIHAEWENEYAQPYPRSLDDWKRWGARVGMTPAEFKQCSYADVAPYIEGYCQRLRDQQAMGQGEIWSVAKAPADWRKELKISESTMRRRINDGTLVVEKITPRLWRIRQDTLRVFLETQV